MDDEFTDREFLDALHQVAHHRAPELFWEIAYRCVDDGVPLGEVGGVMAEIFIDVTLYALQPPDMTDRENVGTPTRTKRQATSNQVRANGGGSIDAVNRDG